MTDAAARSGYLHLLSKFELVQTSSHMRIHESGQAAEVQIGTCLFIPGLQPSFSEEQAVETDEDWEGNEDNATLHMLNMRMQVRQG